MASFTNFASSLVASGTVVGSSSGTALTVSGGDGAKFPTAPFPIVIWPSGTQPTTTNAEVMRVTAVSTDTFTVVRNAEAGGSALATITSGYQVQHGSTAGIMTNLQYFFNVKAYGAVCDSTTDDTTAVQNALNAMTSGGILLVPGLCNIASPLTPLSNTVIMGIGAEASGFVTSMSASTNQGIIQINNKNFIRVTGLKFSMSGSGSAAAITTTGHDTLQIDHCSFTGVTTADGIIEFDGSHGVANMQNTIIEDNKFYSITGQFRTIHIYPRYGKLVLNTIIERNEFISTQGPAIMIDSYDICKDTIIRANKFDNLVSGTHFYDPAVAVYGGIAVGNTIFNTTVTDNIYRNTLTNNTQQGFCYLYSASGTVVSDNQAFGAWTPSVSQAGPAIAPGRVGSPDIGLVITNNFIQGFDAPWDPDSMRNVEVANNTIMNCGTGFNLGYNIQEYVSIHDNVFYNSTGRNNNGTGIAGVEFGNSNPVSCIFTNNLIVDDRSIPTPSNVTAALATGGTLTVATPYFYKITALDQVGETLGSSEVSATPTSGNQSVLLKWAQIIGAYSYNVYRTTASGSYGATSTRRHKSVGGTIGGKRKKRSDAKRAEASGTDS